MCRPVALAVLCWLLVAGAAPAADPKLEDLLGKWVLVEDASGIPKGTVLDFQKDGKLVVIAEDGGERKTFEFKYELKQKSLQFTVGEESERTEITTLDKSELVCRDPDGTTMKLKRAN